MVEPHRAGGGHRIETAWRTPRNRRRRARAFVADCGPSVSAMAEIRSGPHPRQAAAGGPRGRRRHRAERARTSDRVVLEGQRQLELDSLHLGLGFGDPRKARAASRARPLIVWWRWMPFNASSTRPTVVVTPWKALADAEPWARRCNLKLGKNARLADPSRLVQEECGVRPAQKLPDGGDVAVPPMMSAGSIWWPGDGCSGRTGGIC